ncbi:MAG: LysR family transcriptional regulator [Burkholderiaceae bacterium]
MDELASMRTFVQVIEDGSFSAAARRTRTSVSSIARQVKHLEDTLGVRLLNKTTRSQALTEAGRVYYQRAKSMLDELDRTKRDVLAYQSAVKGTLRVFIRVSAAVGVVLPALPRFLARHPELHIDMIVADGQVDLVSNGIDVAVWLGQLEDSSLIARLLSPSPRVLCGSPDYFKRYGLPKHPDRSAPRRRTQRRTGSARCRISRPSRTCAFGSPPRHSEHAAEVLRRSRARCDCRS